jgi:integrase/recombinase XerD
MVKNKQIGSKQLRRFLAALAQAEKSAATLRKYRRDILTLMEFMSDQPVDKTRMIAYKAYLEQRYAQSSVNSMLSAANAFLRFLGMEDCRVKLLRRQTRVFCPDERELTREEYFRLLHTAAAQGKTRLGLVLQTICATGIRVSELQFITIEAVKLGRAQVTLKGKSRVIFLPQQLCQVLTSYLEHQNRTDGPVFITSGGKPLDRSNIWSGMKKLCKDAQVAPQKVYPHNLRHLFARTFYSVDQDLVRLADILGHSSIETTRIYTRESGREHERKIAALGLVMN